MSLIALEQWKAEAKAGEPTSEIRAGFDAEVAAVSDTTRELQFTISTGDIDRSGDTIAVDGWKFDSYRKNPVVLWAHDYETLPLGKSPRVWIEGGAVKAIAEWTPAGMAKFNDVVFDMYKGGFLNAVSVGFRPLKWAWAEDSERRLGVDFMEQELYEFSAVVVPANPHALQDAKSAGIDMEPIMAWAFGVIRNAPPQTIREFEGLLRDGLGFSRKDAAAVASKGWAAMKDAARHTDDELRVAGIIREHYSTFKI